MSSLKPELTGKTADLLKDKTALETYNQPINIKNKTLTKFHIDEHDVKNLHINNSILKKYAHRKSKIQNSSYIKTDFQAASFSDSTLINVSFEDSTFSKVGFIDTTFIDVTFKNCKFQGNKFLGIKGKVTFIDSDLDSVDFHEAQAAITLINSKVHNTFNPRLQTFTNQKVGASIDMTDTTLYDLQIGGTLTHVKVQGGAITKVGIGDNIKEVVFDNVRLEMSMGGVVDTLTIRDSLSNRMGIGEMKINNLIIEDCQPTFSLSLTDGQYNAINIDNCNMESFKPWSITANQLHISDSTFQNTIMSDSKINHLTLKNVTFENGKFDNAMAKETELSGVKLGGGEFNMAGSNIPLQ